MELSYWRSKWRKNTIGFHLDHVYPPLENYWPELDLPEHPTVLVPLCGKTLDMKWLWDRGCHVIGVEISEIAVQNFLETHGFDYQTERRGSFKRYHTERLELWMGDFLKMQPSYLPKIDLVHDRAALVALPGDMRTGYAHTMHHLIGDHTQLLISSFDYPQNEMSGPPFSVPLAEIKELFGDRFKIEIIYDTDRLDALSKFKRRGLSSYLKEYVCYLKPGV